jgi:hypothetical protein
MKRKRPRRASGLLFLCLGIVIVGIWFCARKVGAQPPPREKAPSGPVVRVKLDPKSAKGLAGLDAGLGPVAPAPEAADEKAADKGAKKDDAPKDIYTEDPVDYAEMVTDGGVPIHTEGRFRSPYAHPKYGQAANVRVGLLLANVREYDIQKGTFEADFFLTLTSDRPMPPMDLIFTNGKVDSKEVMADKPTFKMYRYMGQLVSPADLHDYPFDTQDLTIEIEDDDNGVDQIHLIPDLEHTNLDINFEVPGWETAYTKARVNTHNFPDRFDNDDLYYTRYQFTLGIKRYGTSAVFTVFVPAIVIVLISLTGLWITRDELEVRSNATTPMLAAAVLFHFALMQALPATPYLTRADKLMMSVYVILGLHMVISLLWFFFDEKHTDRIFVLGKYIGAPLTIAILAGGILL